MKYHFGLDLETRNSLSILIKRIKPNSTILEFGPAHGRMTRYLKNNLNCKVYAVEIDSNAANDARLYAENIIVDSIENYAWKKQYADIKFDYIIFADVLEHLYDPEKVLNSVKELLKDSGSILVSIPNIAHNSIVIGLLQNDFSYHKTGLLDTTHIRFFTKKTFDSMVLKNGYHIAYESGVFISPQDTEFRNDYTDLPSDIGKYLKESSWGELYQLIYEIKKYKVDKESEIDIKDVKSCKYYSQLYYIEKNDTFSEEESVHVFLDENVKIQTFEFDLTNKKIKNLRLDPLNDTCVIEIKFIELIKEEDVIDLLPYMSTNACFNNDEKLFFDTNDSQIYFEQLSEEILINATKLRVTFDINAFANNALYECIKIKNFLLEHSNKDAMKYHQELEAIYSSKSWKLIKKIHSILSIFKMK